MKGVPRIPIVKAVDDFVEGHALFRVSLQVDENLLLKGFRIFQETSL